jgi:FAD/FMN-containing dehydrogenase
LEKLLSKAIKIIIFDYLYNQQAIINQDHRNIYDNSVHLDMSSMNTKTIDLTKKTLTLGTGNNFSLIQEYVGTQSNYQLVALCDADTGVGIYGWTTGGGHGALNRIYGFGVDALLSINLDLSNFTIITASETQNHDLFRAIRGSGGSAYGIAISLTIRLYDDHGMSSQISGL